LIAEIPQNWEISGADKI